MVVSHGVEIETVDMKGHGRVQVLERIHKLQVGGPKKPSSKVPHTDMFSDGVVVVMFGLVGVVIIVVVVVVVLVIVVVVVML